MSEDIDIGKISEALNDKLDRDGMNAGNPASVVVETYQNGTSWYRVYSDGWCEQGGHIMGVSSGNYTLSFLKPFINTNYVIFKTMHTNSGNEALYCNVSFFNCTVSGATTITAGVDFSWEAKGYIR